jgi:hypothetical protein
MPLELAFSVTIKDCVVQTFRCGGNGGQKVNKTSSGIRVIHPLSGAVGQATDTRSQLQNKTLAFRRMAESGRFQAWVRVQGGSLPPEQQVESDMDPGNLLIMGRSEGKWKIID